MARIPVILKGYIDLPIDDREEMEKMYGSNIGLFATDIEHLGDRLAVEAFQIEVENDLDNFVEQFHIEKVLVTEAEWELDLEPESVDD